MQNKQYKKVWTVHSTEYRTNTYTFSIYDVSAFERLSDLFFIHIKGKETPIQVAKEEFAQVLDAFILANGEDNPCLEM